MPELPDVLLYLAHLERLLVGRPIEKIRILGPFVLQTVRPSPQDAAGRTVAGISRIGKRIVWRLEGDDLFFVFHPMVAGRFHLKKKGAAIPRKNVHAVFELESGVLLFTEASTKKRATLHVVGAAADLKQFDRGGLDVLT